MYQIHISSGSGCSSFERISQLQFWFSAVLFLPPLPFHFAHSDTKLTKPMLPKTPNNILISEWQNGRIIFVLCFATYAVYCCCCFGFIRKVYTKTVHQCTSQILPLHIVHDHMNVSQSIYQVQPSANNFLFALNRNYNNSITKLCAV